jgi:hypothetical protein
VIINTWAYVATGGPCLLQALRVTTALPGLYDLSRIELAEKLYMNLTHMWKAVDGRESQKPAEWLRHDDTQQFIETLEKKFKGGSDPLLKSIRGRYGGTYGHDQITGMCLNRMWPIQRMLYSRPPGNAVLQGLPRPGEQYASNLRLRFAARLLGSVYSLMLHRVKPVGTHRNACTVNLSNILSEISLRLRERPNTRTLYQPMTKEWLNMG